jgi:SAM-dependent methyltransferase
MTEDMTEGWLEGDPVDLYRQLEDAGESALIHSATVPGSSILELGCGTGRMTRKLHELGHTVTAVDSSPAMLDHVPAEANVVRSAIEDLDLEDRFEVVVLASNLINTPDVGLRRRLLISCRRHVSSDGVVVIQRYDPKLSDWNDTDWYARGNMMVRVQDFARSGDLFSARIEYRVGSARFVQSFAAEVLDDLSLRTELETAGLRWAATLDAQRCWVLSTPTSRV